MKQMIIFCFSACLFFGFTACTKDVDKEGIMVNFVNKTGGTIETASAANVQLGSITANGQTGFIRFAQFGKDTGMPDCNFEGLLNNIALKSTSIHYWCGTEKSLLKSGKYTVEVKITNIGTDRYFDLVFVN